MFVSSLFYFGNCSMKPIWRSCRGLGVVRLDGDLADLRNQRVGGSDLLFQATVQALNKLNLQFAMLIALLNQRFLLRSYHGLAAICSGERSGLQTLHGRLNNVLGGCGNAEILQ